MKDFLVGVSYVPRGFSELLRPGYRRYVLIPLLINTLVFIGLFWLSAHEFRHLLDWLTPAVASRPGTGWLHGLLEATVAIVRWLLWPLFLLVAVVVMFYSFTLVANIVASPFNSMLAARVERRLSRGRFPPSLPGGLLKDTLVSIKTEVKKLGYFVLLAIPCLVVSLIPGLNVFAPFVWAAYGAWAVALEYLDYPMANHGMHFAEERKKARSRTLLALGFGGAILAVSVIPLLNLLAMPCAVVAATLLWHEQLKPPDAHDL